MESVILYQKTLFIISFPSLWPLFCFMYRLLFSVYQNTEKGNEAVSSLGTSCVAVCVCVYSTMVFSAGIPGRHHWICWRWPLLGIILECVVFPARVTACSPCFSGGMLEPAGVQWEVRYQWKSTLQFAEVAADFFARWKHQYWLTLCQSVYSGSQKNRC